MDEEKTLTEEPVLAEEVPEVLQSDDAAYENGDPVTAEEGGMPAEAQPGKKKKKGGKWQAKNQWKAWLYLLPAIAILAVFTVWPIINTIRMSFLDGFTYSAQMTHAKMNFGVKNFQAIVGDSDFLNALGNTMLLTVITVPVSTMLALLIAVGLNSIKWLKKVYQTIFFLPYVTNTIAIGMVFLAMFNIIGSWAGGMQPSSIGLINKLIVGCGGKPIDWINESSSKVANMAVLMIFIIWNALPFKILVLLGGLQNVDKQYYDAAKVDGASRFRIFWRVTVPLLSPMIAYVVITGFIGGFKEYNSVIGIFGEDMGPTGSPGRLMTMVGLIMNRIEDGSVKFYGEASAGAIILFLIIFAVTLINLYVSKKKVHY